MTKRNLALKIAELKVFISCFSEEFLHCQKSNISIKKNNYSNYCIRPNYCTERLGFSKLLETLVVKYVSAY